MSNLYLDYDPRLSIAVATVTREVGKALIGSAVVIERQWPGLSVYDWTKGGFERADREYLELGSRVSDGWDEWIDTTGTVLESYEHMHDI